MKQIPNLLLLAQTTLNILQNLYILTEAVRTVQVLYAAVKREFNIAKAEGQTCS